MRLESAAGLMVKLNRAHHCSLHFVGYACEQCHHNNNVPILLLLNRGCFLSWNVFQPLSVLWQERHEEGFRPVTGQDHLNQPSHSSNSSFIPWISTLLSVWPHKLVSPCCLSLAFVLRKCTPEEGERAQGRNSFHYSKFWVIFFTT